MFLFPPHDSFWQRFPGFPWALDPDGTLWRGQPGGRQGRGAAVPLTLLEVEGISLLWRDPAFQQQWLERFRRLLLALSFPLQLILQNEAAAFSWPSGPTASGARERSRTRPGSLRQQPGQEPGPDAPGRDPLCRPDLAGLEQHPLQLEQRFLQELLQRSEVRRQRVLLVVGGDSQQAPRSRRRWWHWGTREPRSRPSPSPSPFQRTEEEQARRLLEERVAALEQLLATLGLPVRRLSASAVLEVLYRRFHPERAYRLFSPDLEQLTAGVNLSPSPSTAGLEWVAPTSLVSTSQWLEVDGHRIRCWIVRAWPRELRGFWLWPLILSDLDLDISFHLVPVPTASVLRLLKRKALEVQSSLALRQERQLLIAPQEQLAHADLQRLLEQLTTGEEQILLTSCYLALYGKDELEQPSARLEQLLCQQLQVHAVQARYEQDRVWAAVLPLARDDPKAGLLLDTRTLATCFPFLSPSVLQPSGILEGCSAEGVPVFLDRWDASWKNANRLIVGASGAGKSFKVKLDVLRWLARTRAADAEAAPADADAGGTGTTRAQEPPPEHLHVLPAAAGSSSGISLASPQAEGAALIEGALPALMPPSFPPSAMGSSPPYQAIVVDPEGEYRALCRLLRGRLISLRAGGPETAPDFSFNPFALLSVATRDEEEEHETLLAEQVQWILSLLEILLRRDQDPSLSAAEWALLERAVRECYRERGITAQTLTQPKQPQFPLLRDLSRILQSGVCGPDTSGLAERLQPFVTGSAAALFASPQAEPALQDPLVVVDLHALPPSLRPVASWATVHWIWRQVQAQPRFRQLVLDELWGLYAEMGPSGKLLLERLFQRARKYGLAIDGVTQHLGILKQTSILANCACVVLLGQEPAAIPFLQECFGLSQAEARLLASLSKGEGLLLLEERQHLVVRFPAGALHPFLSTDPRDHALQDRVLRAWPQSRRGSRDRQGACRVPEPDSLSGPGPAPAWVEEVEEAERKEL